MTKKQSITKMKRETDNTKENSARGKLSYWMIIIVTSIIISTVVVMLIK